MPAAAPSFSQTTTAEAAASSPVCADDDDGRRRWKRSGDSVCPDGGSGRVDSVCADDDDDGKQLDDDGGAGTVCPDGGSGCVGSVCPTTTTTVAANWSATTMMASGDRVCLDDGSCGPVCDNNGDKGWLSAEDGTADAVPGCAEFPSTVSIIKTPFLSTTIRCAEAMPTRALKRNTKLNTIDVARQR